MARFPSLAALNPFGTGGTVSFTREQAAAPMTIDALMLRQKQLAERQQAAIGEQQTTVPGGIGQMLRAAMAGHGEYSARQEEAQGRQELVNAIRGIDATGVADMDTIASVMARDPDLGEALYAGALKAKQDAANRETWEDIPAPEGSKPGQQWQRSSKTGKVQAVGGGGVNVTVPVDATTKGDVAWSEAGSKKFGERVDAYSGEGVAARQQLNQIDQLEFLMRDMPTGLDAKAVDYLRTNWGVSLGEGADKLQAFDAIISKMVPSQRPAGSGTMSDRDIELFRKSLPSYLNDPAGNQMILASMRGIAQYNAQLGAIADEAMQIPDIAEARRFFTERVNALEDPLAAWRASEAEKENAGAGTAAGGTATPSPTTGPADSQSTFETMPDGRKKVTMPDGTIVIMNPKPAGG